MKEIDFFVGNFTLEDAFPLPIDPEAGPAAGPPQVRGGHTRASITYTCECWTHPRECHVHTHEGYAHLRECWTHPHEDAYPLPVDPEAGPAAPQVPNPHL